MALETASSISGLVASNPPDGDPAQQGANHLRLIKNVLKTSFPNLNAPITGTPAKFNNGNVPTGSIIMWSGASLPAGWALCDGNTYAREDGSGNLIAPNLVSQFIRGSTLANIGTTGGLAASTPTITVNGTTLTTDQIPAHTHPINDPGHGHAINDPGHFHAYFKTANQNGNLYTNGNANNPNQGGSNDITGSKTTGITIVNGTTGITGTAVNSTAGSAHNHTATSSSVPTIPPYFSLAFIIRL